MTDLLDVLFRVVFESAIHAMAPARSLQPKPASPGMGIHARRHVVASYRAWARQHRWTSVNETWEGTMRGLATKVRTHLNGDLPPGAVEVNVAATITREPATLRGAEDAAATLPELAPLFADGVLARIRWTAEIVDFRFAPLTMPETVTETCEAALAILLAPLSPYR